MIKLTLKDVEPMVESLNIVMNLPLPAKDSYRFGIAAKLIKERMAIYEQTRQNLIVKLGEKIEKEGVIRVKTENIEAFQKEIDSLRSEVIEVNMDPIPLEVLGDAKVTALDMSNLSLFFRDDSL